MEKNRIVRTWITTYIFKKTLLKSRRTIATAATTTNCYMVAVCRQVSLWMYDKIIFIVASVSIDSKESRLILLYSFPFSLFIIDIGCMQLVLSVSLSSRKGGQTRLHLYKI